MSRCLPYPPPGHGRNGGHGEPVIKPIKFQSQSKNGLTERGKEREGEKKEERKGKKENKDTTFIGFKNPQGEKVPFDKGREDEAESSGITEEHEQPVCAQNLSYSSDSAQSGIKEKRDKLASNDGGKPRNIIRIRLPLKRHKEADVSANSEQCPPPGKADAALQQKQIFCIPGQKECCSIKPQPGTFVKELISRPEEALTSESNGADTALGTKLYDNEMPAADSPYNAVIRDWVPLPIQFEQNDYEDQEWLFGTRTQERHAQKRPKSCNDISSDGTPTLWPHARHLPETNVYALPYTVPF